MTGILNLTKDAVTLIAESGEKTTIEPSGYVARVEYERRLSVREPICEANDGGYITIGSDDIPIYEQTSGEIVFTCTEDKDGNIPSDFIAEVAGKNKGLFLVDREVAEAAAQGFFVHDIHGATESVVIEKRPHPLASRMVWADDPVPCDSSASCPNGWEKCCRKDGDRCIIGYRELRRVGGVG